MEKHMELDHLPKNTKGHVDWENCIGYTCRFKYGDVSGTVEIKDYKKKGSRVIFEYNGKIYNTQSGRFRDVQFKNILGIITPKFRLDVGDEIKDDKRDLIVIGKFYKKDINNRKYKSYKYKCKICGYEGSMTEYDLMNKYHGCSCCSGKTVLKGFNDIATTHPHIVKYFVDKEDAYKYSYCSGKRVLFKCPYCGSTKMKIISEIVRKDSVPCMCKDGKSYPEKFLFNVLTQSKLKFETQYSPNWAKNKKYDFYIPKHNMIIETHGEQHYTNHNQFRKTLKEEQENDKFKEDLARNNGIKTYIQLDCRKSTVEHIKESIHKSELINYIKLEDIDWKEVNEFANKNIIKYVCDEYNKYNDQIPMKDIAKRVNVSYAAFHKYLKIGNELGFCVYRNKTKKPIKIIETGEVFESAVECSKIYKELHDIDFNVKIISYILKKNKNKDYYGYHFEYAEEKDYAS